MTITLILVSIILAAALWSQQWKGMTIRARCDNAAMVSIIKPGKGSHASYQPSFSHTSEE
jgi:hypothetical protein